MQNSPISQTSGCASFPGIVSAVVAGNRMLSRISPNASSILQPENREFLENQGQEPLSPVFGFETMHFVKKAKNKFVNKKEPFEKNENKIEQNFIENNPYNPISLRRTISAPLTSLSSLDDKFLDSTETGNDSTTFKENDDITHKNLGNTIKNVSLFTLVNNIKESKQRLIESKNITQDLKHSCLEKYAHEITRTVITDVLNHADSAINNQECIGSSGRRKSLLQTSFSVDFPDPEGDRQTELESKKVGIRWQESLQVHSDCVASQHSFDLEEILSAPDDEVPMMIPGVEKKSLLGKLIRTSSTQSDSSGFGDSDVTEINITDNSSLSGDIKIKGLHAPIKNESDRFIDNHLKTSLINPIHLKPEKHLVPSMTTESEIEIETNDLKLPMIDLSRRPSSEVSVQEWLALKREHEELIQMEDYKDGVFLTVPKLEFDDLEDEDPDVEALIKILNPDDPYLTYKAEHFGSFWNKTLKQRAFQEVRLMQEALRKYKSQMKNMEVLSYSCYQPVYKILPVNIKMEVDALNELCIQIMDEVLEMERLLANKMKTIIGSDDQMTFVLPLRMLNVIGPMVTALSIQSDLLKEYKLEDYKASARVSRTREAWQIESDLSQQLNILRQDLQKEYHLSQETTKTFLDELKVSILGEIRRDFSLENARLKEQLEVKEKEIQHLRESLKRLKRKS